MAAQPLDMRIGSEAALARVVAVFGAAHPHHAYLFANRRANRMKALVHDGIGVWLVARRLNVGKFIWSSDNGGNLQLSTTQLDCSSDCWSIRTTASTSCCRISGNRRPERQAMLRRFSQGGVASRLLHKTQEVQ